MRYLTLAAFFALTGAAGAHAHPGHLAGLAGHDHWVAGAAIGAAIAVGAWAALKGRRRGKSESAPDQDDPAAAESEG